MNAELELIMQLNILTLITLRLKLSTNGPIVILGLIHISLTIYLAQGRLMDMNKNPSYSAATLFPFVSFFLIFPKGTEGKNQYGEGPRDDKKRK